MWGHNTLDRCTLLLFVSEFSGKYENKSQPDAGAGPRQGPYQCSSKCGELAPCNDDFDIGV